LNLPCPRFALAPPVHPRNPLARDSASAKRRNKEKVWHAFADPAHRQIRFKTTAKACWQRPTHGKLGSLGLEAVHADMLLRWFGWFPANAREPQKHATQCVGYRLKVEGTAVTRDIPRARNGEVWDHRHSTKSQNPRNFWQVRTVQTPMAKGTAASWGRWENQIKIGKGRNRKLVS